MAQPVSPATELLVIGNNLGVRFYPTDGQLEMTAERDPPEWFLAAVSERADTIAAILAGYLLPSELHLAVPPDPLLLTLRRDFDRSLTQQALDARLDLLCAPAALEAVPATLAFVQLAGAESGCALAAAAFRRRLNPAAAQLLMVLLWQRSPQAVILAAGSRERLKGWFAMTAFAQGPALPLTRFFAPTSLPETVQVYRAGEAQGYSWTTQRSIAARDALTRDARCPTVWTAVVHRAEISLHAAIGAFETVVLDAPAAEVVGSPVEIAAWANLSDEEQRRLAEHDAAVEAEYNRLVDPFAERAFDLLAEWATGGVPSAPNPAVPSAHPLPGAVPWRPAPRPAFRTLPTPADLGLNPEEPLYLVAGGPSNRALNWGRVDGLPTLAVNRAFEALPGAKIIFGLDWIVWDAYRNAVEAHAARLKVFANDPGREYPEYITVAEPSNSYGYSDLPLTLCHAGNSGYAAINLAGQLGFKHLILLGYDMKTSPRGDTHWHGPYPWAPTPPYVINQWKYLFVDLVEPLKQRGIRVENGTPGSACTCFPFVDTGFYA